MLPPEEEPVRNLTEAFEHLHASDDDNDLTRTSYHWKMHPSLQLELSQDICDRVSLYSIIHDVNKEATSMAAKDPLQKATTHDETVPNVPPPSPLVAAAMGGLNHDPNASPATEITHALIDEERWLLTAIDDIQQKQHEPNDKPKACPPTFWKAMGEEEYEINIIDSLSKTTRTQLWKPSRSWWEAKSGKNPWIEPSSHNKRWRYLWPLIHYHKFLAKCIKKLKRNNVDVTTDNSTLAVFLREDVCAVSDHLAHVSMFGSEEWMQCLSYFQGWIDISPQGEEYIRHMMASLALRPLQEYNDVESPLLRSRIDAHVLRTLQNTRQLMQEPSTHSQKKQDTMPRSSVPQHIESSAPAPPMPNQWYPWYPWSDGNMPDNASVHSGVTMESHIPYEHAAYPPPPVHCFGPDGESIYVPWMEYYHLQQAQFYFQQYHIQREVAAAYESPHKFSSRAAASNMPSSPYWSHLDQATLSMGLATPSKNTPPRQSRGVSLENHTAVAPLLRQPYVGGHFPPSPATQFLMSPQKQQQPKKTFSRTPKKPVAAPTPVSKNESPSTVETTCESESLAPHH